MKIKILLVNLFLISSSLGNAQDKNCNCGLTKAVQSYLESNQTNNLEESIKDWQERKLSKDKVSYLAAKLCGNINFSSSAGFKPQEFKSIILKDIGASESLSEEEKNKKVTWFLNTYKNELICAPNHLKRDDRPLHLYKTAILDGVIDLFDELTDDDLYQIDWNSYEIIDGKKETVIDYLDKVLNGVFSDNEDLEMLREDLLDMGAKRGKDLKD